MAYAALEKAGKFVDNAKIDLVSNLAEAERLRKVEAARKKAEKEAALKAEVSAQESEVTVDDVVAVKLKKSQIGPRAKKLAMPLLEECRGYDEDTKTKLLEELIDLLTQELEK